MRGDPAQARRAAEVARLFRQRSAELGPAAYFIQQRGGAQYGGLLEQATRRNTLDLLRTKLEEIAAAERTNLDRRTAATQGLVDRADTYTDLLGLLGILIGLGAVGLAFLAWRAFVDGLQSRREAEEVGWHALDLEQAVQTRTRELSTANESLKREAAERAAAEAQLRQVQKMEAVGQLTGGIAHDFNNMLAVIVGGLDLARRKLHGSRREVEFHLDNAMEGATRAAALTRRLLAFARAEPLLPEAVAPAQLIEQHARADRPGDRRADHRPHRFRARFWHVWADPTQFENAILNLAVNARDAMDGRGELDVCVDNITPGRGGDRRPARRRLCPDPGHRHRQRHRARSISTGSSSPSSPPRMSARAPASASPRSSPSPASPAATSPSPRASATAPPSPSICRARPPPPSRRGQVPPRIRHAEPAARGGRGAAVLVVEDDPRVSRATVAALEELGYRPYPCASGKEALAVLKREPNLALVVTDVMMPEMTGTELAAEVKRRRPDMRILFVTGYVGEAGDSGDLAGHAVLRKPFTVAALASSVEAALGGDERRRQRIAPRRSRRGSRVSAPRIGQRRCQGFTTICVPACRLIFQAI